jgi:hypothetical protein
MERTQTICDLSKSIKRRINLNYRSVCGIDRGYIGDRDRELRARVLRHDQTKS